VFITSILKITMIFTPALFLSAALFNGSGLKCSWEGNIAYEGIQYFPCNERYEGDWKDNKRYGYGVHCYAHGERYEGDWQDNMKHGFGIHYFGNGDKYEGE